MTIKDPKRNIKIAGAGSIGFFIGGLLQLAGHKVCFLARERMIKKIRADGLHLTDYTGQDETIEPGFLDLATEPQALSVADVILVTVKSSATEEMATLIQKHAKDTATVISLQNGISNAETLKKVLPNHEVLAGMVPFNVAQMDKGRFHRGTSGNIVIEAGSENLAKDLTSNQLMFEQTGDIQSVQWGKLLINLNNAFNALSGLPLLDQLGDRNWRRIMADQMSEALKVYEKAGINAKPPSPVPVWLIPHILRLPTPLFKVIAKQMLSIDPYARSSMWEDLQQGRKTEIGELQGKIIELAEQHGLNVPIHKRVMTRVLEAEELKNGSPNLRPEDI